MKILLAASECAPVAKVGGLADVVGSLPKALKKQGIDVSVLLPFYEAVNIEKDSLRLLQENIPIVFNQKEDSFNLWQTFLPNSRVPLLLVEHKKYFSGKEVYIESDASSGGSKKEAERFLFLSAAGIKAAEIMSIDLLHCQDWHTAIIPFLVKEKKGELKTLLTIHNLGYQGIYPSETVNQLLDTDFKGEVNCLELGIRYADFINTVSPSYAEEILTKEFGEGLEDYLEKRKKHLKGILNGIDTETWDPKQDNFLEKKYSLENIKDKTVNKAFLIKKCFGEDSLEHPVLGIVSRLAEQKGIDLIKEVFPELMKKDLRFIILGTGDPEYKSFLKKMAEEFPDKVWVNTGFDEELAHQIYAGADIFLMPSRFEPCGLGQQISMRYGTVPLARAVGGIKDTVIQARITDEETEGTGFLFQQYQSQELLKALESSLRLYYDKEKWRKIMINCMSRDFTWENSAAKYKTLYQKILEQ